MGYMEIVLLAKNGLKIKGKQTVLLVSCVDKSTHFSGIIALGGSDDRAFRTANTVVINGPGEYEIGGIKITGFRADSDAIYSLKVDDVDVLLGTIQDLENMHQKLKEHNLVVVNVGSSTKDASFVTGLSSNAVLYYGDEAEAVVKSFVKEAVQKLSKYQTTKDKLPQEMETVLLA